MKHGQINAIMGASGLIFLFCFMNFLIHFIGAGKTSLLNLLACKIEKKQNKNEIVGEV